MMKHAAAMKNRHTVIAMACLSPVALASAQIATWASLSAASRALHSAGDSDGFVSKLDLTGDLPGGDS